MFELLHGTGEAAPAQKKGLNLKWKNIESFFEKYSLTDILQKNFDGNGIPMDEAQKISKTLSFKAPVALRIADQLIAESKGCASELDHLREIFSTSDALLGLTSIGKKVEYAGK